MVLKKVMVALFFTVFGSMCIFAENIRISIDITDVIVNGGNVHVGIFTNERDQKRDIPYATFILESTNSSITFDLELPEGDCYIWGYQDLNNNGKLDTGFFGIPNEPIALTNYSGKGIPGGFNKHKVPVNRNNTRISISLNVIRL